MRGPTIVLGLVFVACEPLPPQSMSDIAFPEGFQLDTQREVTVTVTAREGADPSTFLTVRTEGGDMLFEGPASFAIEHGLKLRLPPGTAALEVREGTTGAPVLVPIDGTEASFQVQG